MANQLVECDINPETIVIIGSQKQETIVNLRPALNNNLSIELYTEKEGVFDLQELVLKPISINKQTLIIRTTNQIKPVKIVLNISNKSNPRIFGKNVQFLENLEINYEKIILYNSQIKKNSLCNNSKENQILTPKSSQEEIEYLRIFDMFETNLKNIRKNKQQNLKFTNLPELGNIEKKAIDSVFHNPFIQKIDQGEFASTELFDLDTLILDLPEDCEVRIKSDKNFRVEIQNESRIKKILLYNNNPKYSIYGNYQLLISDELLLSEKGLLPNTKRNYKANCKITIYVKHPINVITNCCLGANTELNNVISIGGYLGVKESKCTQRYRNNSVENFELKKLFDHSVLLFEDIVKV
jgi:hypothetical protein